jgi:putative cell wall-binding protein
VLWEVASLAADAGRVLIAEPRKGRVRLVDSSGRISTFAGATGRSVFHDVKIVPNFAAGNGGPASSAQLPATTGLAVSADGGIYVADQLVSVVRRIEPDGLARSILGDPDTSGDITGPTPAAEAFLAGPTGITVSADGSLYIADGGRAVRRLRSDGVLENVAGGYECKEDLGHGEPALGTELHEVTDVATTPEGGLYLVEAVTGHLRYVDPQGRMHILVGPTERPCPGPDGGGVTWHHEGSPLTGALGVAASPDGSVWIATPACLHQYTAAAGVRCVAPLTLFGPEAGDGGAYFGGWPTASRPDVVVDRDGVVTFTDPRAHAVRRVGLDGSITTVAGNGTNACAPSSGAAATASLAIPTQLALHPDGSVIVADAACRTLHRIGVPETETVARAAGLDRLATAAHASRSVYDNGAAGAVVLARADDYADALSGTPLAVSRKGPLLLTPSSHLAAWPESELRRVLPAGGAVYLLGGEAALSRAVATRVRDLGYVVVRLGGRDRFQTAVDVAESGLGSPDKVLLTTGTGFADALGAAVAAANTGAAVLLTAGSRPATASVDYLRRHGMREHYAVGGPAAKASPTSVAIVGADRYSTAAAVAARFFPDPSSVALVTGTSFPDALSGGAAIGSRGGPLLLTATSKLSPSSRDYLAAHRSTLQHLLVLGGEAVVSAGTRAAAATAAR